jgi:hypothetical protein
VATAEDACSSSSCLLALQDATQLQLQCARARVCMCVRVWVPSSQVVQVAFNVVPVTAAAAAVVTAAVTAATATPVAVEAAAAAAIGLHCDAQHNTRQHGTDTVLGWMRCPEWRHTRRRSCCGCPGRRQVNWPFEGQRRRANSCSAAVAVAKRGQKPSERRLCVAGTQIAGSSCFRDRAGRFDGRLAV